MDEEFIINLHINKCDIINATIYFIVPQEGIFFFDEYSLLLYYLSFSIVKYEVDTETPLISMPN